MVGLVVVPEEFEMLAAIPLGQIDDLFHAVRKTLPWAIIPRFAQSEKSL
jgi:hypothetical protein